MLKKTHISVGIATSLAITAPSTGKEVLTAIVAGAIGSQLPDIDSTTSKSHKDADMICLSSIILLVTSVVADKQFKLGLVNKLLKDGNIAQIVFGFLLLVAICAYGKDTNHRTFMHSILGCILTATAVWISVPFATISFVCGYMSHILIDLLNKRKVHFLYPTKKGFCFNMCRSDGYVNRALCIIGALSSTIILLALI